MFFETTYNAGLSDYVHAGAKLFYQATVAPYDPVSFPWESPGSDRCAKLRQVASNHVRISTFGCDVKNGSINLQATIPGDFADESHVKSILDGAITEAGFGYRASVMRLISNPGGGSSFPLVPAAAGATYVPERASLVDTAANWWATFAGDAAHALLPTSSLGMGMSIGALALIGVGAYLLLKR